MVEVWRCGVARRRQMRAENTARVVAAWPVISEREGNNKNNKRVCL